MSRSLIALAAGAVVGTMAVVGAAYGRADVGDTQKAIDAANENRMNICLMLDYSPTPATVVQIVNALHQRYGWSDGDEGAVIRIAVKGGCPEYWEMIYRYAARQQQQNQQQATTAPTTKGRVA